MLKRLARQTIPHAITHVPGFRAMDRMLRRYYTGRAEPELFPRGHFYSPLPDLEEVKAKRGTLFRQDAPEIQGVELRRDAQRALLLELARYYPDFVWHAKRTPDARFHFDQGSFREADALILQCMLRHHRPRRVIEVGSGFSSALMLDTDERFLGGATEFTFVEPYPALLHSLLRPLDAARITVHATPVQDVPLSVFSRLEAGDLLFIDSTHVSRIGSDVNRLVFEVLPALAPGVLVHFHDIIWPFEYFERWVMNGHAWNEAYLLRAFLQYNTVFEVMFFNSMIGHELRSLVQEVMPRFLDDTGGSLWLRKQ